VIGGEVDLPHQLAGGGLQAVQVAHGAQRVDAAAVHHGRTPRAGGVSDPGVGAVVVVLPDGLAVLGVQAEDAFLALTDPLAGVGARLHGWRLLAGGQLAVHDVDAVPDDRRAAVAAADRHFPHEARAALGEAFEDAVFPPDGVAFGTEPLGPVVGH